MKNFIILLLISTNIYTFNIDLSKKSNNLNMFFNSMEFTSKEFKSKYKSEEKLNEIIFLSNLFEKNFKINKNQKIPKIIHQIWVGHKPLPENCKLMQEKWKKFHPNWEYILWTDENVKNLKLINRELYDKTKDMREKADLLRYELLNQFGGLYVDSDYECIKNFDELLIYDFFVGISPNNVNEIINNAIIGSIKGHDIIQNIIKNVKYHEIPDWRNRSGVFYFDNEVRKQLQISTKNNIAFPKNYFYPIPFNFEKNNESIIKYIKSESMALHYWMNSAGTNWNWKPQK